MTLLRALGTASLLTLSLNFAAQAQEQNPSSVEPLVMDLLDVEWSAPSDRPGYPSGLRNAPVATDPNTGGITYLAKFPAGSQFDMHWHTHTETVVVLQGSVDITLDGKQFTANQGSYVIIPGRTHHAWLTHADGDAILLARRDGPPDFHFIEP